MSLALFSHIPQTCVVLALVGLSSGASAEDASPEALVTALQAGGHVIYLRHAATETDYADQVDAVIGDCATQRVLSAAGWADAKEIGNAFDRLAIPLGDVISSGYCRAWQTADLAAGRFDLDSGLHFAKAENYGPADLAQMKAGVVPLLSAPASTAGNRLIVGHDDPFEAATGIYPEPQGVAYVLKPMGDGFEILGHIDPDAWPQQ